MIVAAIINQLALVQLAIAIMVWLRGANSDFNDAYIQLICGAINLYISSSKFIMVI